MQESPVSHADTRSVELVRLNDESENDDSRFSADDSLDQETSQSLVPHSQNMDPASSIAESSQSIIPHSEEPGLRLNEIKHMRGDVLGESSASILVALTGSDFIVVKIIAQF